MSSRFSSVPADDSAGTDGRAEKDSGRVTGPDDWTALLKKSALDDEAAFADLYDLSTASIYGLIL